MTFDPSINLGGMIHLVVSLVAALITVAVVWGTIKATLGGLQDQIAGIRSELKEIKESLGCTDDDVARLGEGASSFKERLAAAERDIAWLKATTSEREED